MKKRLTHLLIIIGLLFTVLSPTAYAQGIVEGTFDCVWTVRCTANPTNDCEDGYEPDAEYCYNNYRDLAPCNSANNIPCIAVTPGASGDYFKPLGCPNFECPPGDEDLCRKYPHIPTALGCIPTHPVAFVSQFMVILLGMGGGIAFLLMIVGAAFVLTSRGQPEQIQRGKQVFISALVGLLMIIFSTFLLELIGVDIIKIFRP